MVSLMHSGVVDATNQYLVELWCRAILRAFLQMKHTMSAVRQSPDRRGHLQFLEKFTSH